MIFRTRVFFCLKTLVLVTIIRIVKDHISKKILELRQKRGLTQDELGALAKVDGRQLSRYENGKVKPSKRILARLCEVLEVAPEVFYEASEPEDEQIQDEELYRQFLALDRMDAKEKDALKIIINAVLTKHRAQKFFLQEAG